MQGLGLELAHSVVYVKDMDRMTAFYEEVLGFEVTDSGPAFEDGPVIRFLSQSAQHHHQIAFLQIRDEPGRSNSHDHLAFRSSGTLDDLRALLTELQSQDDVTRINPMSHGNAWSIYFQDPEGNGVEVYIDTPFHVDQPQGQPYDLSKSDEEILEWTKETFGDAREFEPIADYYARRATELAARNGS